MGARGELGWRGKAVFLERESRVGTERLYSLSGRAGLARKCLFPNSVFAMRVLVEVKRKTAGAKVGGLLEGAPHRPLTVAHPPSSARGSDPGIHALGPRKRPFP